MADNGTILDRINAEGLNGGDTDVIDDLVAESFVEHNPPPGMHGDREGFKQMIREIHAAFPDFHTEVQDQIVAGDKVVERWTADGTHEGEWLGIPATGKKVHFEGIDISRLEDGRLVEHWTQMDTVTMLQQLGVIPTEEEAPA